MRNLLFAVLFLSGIVSQAKVVTKNIEYKDGAVVMEGVLAYDDSKKAVTPGVLVIHDWMGISDDTIKRIKMLAELGYTAFAADIYGKGVRPKDTKEAAALATQYKSDIKTLRSRVLAGYEVLKKQNQVDSKKTAAMGYCFGGTTALELARSGADLDSVISFHGGLSTPQPADAKNIKAQVLVLHGADDPYVPAKEVAAFEKEMKDAGVKWKMISYPGAVHAFTVKGAGSDKSKGAAYDEKADKQSWNDMKKFFKETL